MPARKNQYIAVDGAHAAHNTIRARSNLIRRFSAGTAVAKQLPVGMLRTNHQRSETFELAVVPLDQIGIDFGCGPEAGQFAGASGALQGTREDLCESQSG